MRANPVLAAVCGFEDHNHTPGVGTFYDFIDRLWLSYTPQKATQAPKSKRGKRPKSGEKLAPKHPGIVKKLVEQALVGRVINKRPEKILQQILKECAVKPSSKLGLLGNPNKILYSI